MAIIRFNFGLQIMFDLIFETSFKINGYRGVLIAKFSKAEFTSVSVLPFKINAPCQLAIIRFNFGL